MFHVTFGVSVRFPVVYCVNTLKGGKKKKENFIAKMNRKPNSFNGEQWKITSSNSNIIQNLIKYVIPIDLSIPIIIPRNQERNLQDIVQNFYRFNSLKFESYCKFGRWKLIWNQNQTHGNMFQIPVEKISQFVEKHSSLSDVHTPPWWLDCEGFASSFDCFVNVSLQKKEYGK